MRATHRRILASLALATIAAAAGCERDDSIQTTLNDARIKMRSVAPGGGLSRPELRATTFREVSQSLRQVTTSDKASPGQVAAAHLMISSAESGLAGPKAHETTTRLNEASRLVSQMRSIAIERGAATSTAAVLASYSPGAEIAEIDSAIRDTQAELEESREDLAALEEKIESLRQQAAAEVEQARALRATEADIRSEALAEGDIAAAELVAQAARIGRQADAHEVAAANLEAEMEMLEPEAAQLELRIEGALAKAASLNKAREGIGARAQVRSASARQAGERGGKYESELDQLISQVVEVSREITATATEAAEAYDRAAASAARAAQHARKSARAASGKARHSAATLRLALAEHLLDTGELLSDLTQGERPLGSARTVAATAERLTTDGIAQLQGALESYRAALSDLETSGAGDNAVSALQGTIERIERRLQDAGAGEASGMGGAGDDFDDADPIGEPLDDPAGDPGEDAGPDGSA